jgi:predicted transcriptional regulator
MQSNTGNTNVGNVPFVKLFEKGVMQFVILEKAKQGEVTKDNLRSVFRGNLQMSEDHLDSCIQQLVQNGHLEESGNKYTITDDGREDIQKVQAFVPELQQYVRGGSTTGTQQQGMGQQQRSGMAQQTTTGGSTTSGGNVGGQNPSTQQRSSGTQNR